MCRDCPHCPNPLVGIRKTIGPCLLCAANYFGRLSAFGMTTPCASFARPRSRLAPAGIVRVLSASTWKLLAILGSNGFCLPYLLKRPPCWQSLGLGGTRTLTTHTLSFCWSVMPSALMDRLPLNRQTSWSSFHIIRAFVVAAHTFGPSLPASCFSTSLACHVGSFAIRR